MDKLISEASYPLSFRKQDAATLGRHLKLRTSVELVGIKRVGISNFLRFFLNHKEIVPHYINHGEKHLFITVDLNDLVERELGPFWILSFKRLADSVEQSALSNTTKIQISSLFENSIQTSDLFLTLENLRKAIQMILAEDVLPTFFLVRFDRLEDAITNEFFNNIEGFIENSQHKVVFVFTSFKPLDQIKPAVFNRRDLSAITQVMFLNPANKNDTNIIFQTFIEKFRMTFSSKMIDSVITLSAGHVQYLHLILIILHEQLGEKSSDLTRDQILSLVLDDERIRLQSEEIWESLSKEEQDALIKLVEGKKLQTLPAYLEKSGIVTKNRKIFNILLEKYIQEVSSKKDEIVEFSKKEKSLYTVLLTYKDEVCERETIIHEVWPEYEEIGVSDWTIDRLVARLRQKLAAQHSPYTIVTVKTRGYKLV